MLHVFALALLVPAALAAQQPALEPLKPTTGRIDSVAQLFTARELGDGRVLILGGRRELLVADFAKRRVDTIPAITHLVDGRLLALPGDTTLVAGTTTGWIFLQGTKTLGMLPLTNPVVAAATAPVGADRGGSVMAVTRGKTIADSDIVLLVARTSGAQEVVARLWAPSLPSGQLAPVFWVKEAAAIAPDGWIAVIRSHPYRVDWRNPAGEWVRGAPIETSPTRMDDREKSAYVARTIQPPGGSVRAWPAFIEPFQVPQPIIAPDGSVLVKRTPTADRPGAWYDVINRRGELVRAVSVGEWPSAQIVAFGATSVYVWVNNAVHKPLGHLERHPWP
jgi:hypothetical protein